MTDRARLLVDARTLAAQLSSPRPPLVIDVRWNLSGPPGKLAYETGHVPGALFADLDVDLSGHRGPSGRHPLPGAADFQAAMRRIGVRVASAVVVYDAGNSVPAARAWWDLRYFGHHDVRVLDGGYAAWRAADLPVSKEIPAVEPGDFVARPGQLPMVDADGAARIAAAGALIDVRAGQRFRGEVEPVDPVAGHIPGALNLPTDGNVGSDGTFLDVETLRERFAPLADRADRADRADSAAYCGSGINAAHNRFRDDTGRLADARAFRRLVVKLDRRSRPTDRHGRGVARVCALAIFALEENAGARARRRRSRRSRRRTHAVGRSPMRGTAMRRRAARDAVRP